MARKLNHSERQEFEEIVRTAEPSSIEISPEKFLRRLNEQQETPLRLNQLGIGRSWAWMDLLIRWHSLPLR